MGLTNLNVMNDLLYQWQWLKSPQYLKYAQYLGSNFNGALDVIEDIFYIVSECNFDLFLTNERKQNDTLHYFVCNKDNLLLFESHNPPFYLGYGLIACHDENHFYIYNHLGKINIPYQITQLHAFGDNTVCTLFAIFSNENNNKGLINRYGEICLAPEYESITIDADGNIKAKKIEKYIPKEYYFDIFLRPCYSNFINKDIFQYDLVKDNHFGFIKADYGIFEVQSKDDVDLIALVSNRGDVLAPFDYWHFNDFSNGLMCFARHESKEDKTIGILKYKSYGIYDLIRKRIIVESDKLEFSFVENHIVCEPVNFTREECGLDSPLRYGWSGKTFYRGNEHDYTNEPLYSSIQHFYDDFFLAYCGNSVCVIDSNANILLDGKYSKIERKGNFIFAYQKYDVTVIEIYNMAFEKISPEYPTICNIEKTALDTYIFGSYKGCGVFDKWFNLLIPPVFSYIKLSDYVYVTDKGNFNIDGRYIANIGALNQILYKRNCYIESIDNLKYLLLTIIEDTGYGMNLIKGLIDYNLEICIKPVFEYIFPTFSDNLFIGKQEYKYGLIDASTGELMKPLYDEITELYDTSQFLVKTYNKCERLYGLLDSYGNIIVSCCKFIGNQSSQYRTIYRNSDWCIVNTSNGIMITIPNLTYLGRVSEGYVRVCKEGELEWHGNTPKVKNAKWGLCDLFGNFVIKCQYENMKSLSHGLIPAKLNDKWGIIKLDNSILIPFQFVRVNIEDNNIHCYSDEYNYDIFDFNGKQIGNGEDEQEDNYYEPNEPDPWGAKSELDYIRKNGGDWIDDVG